MIKNHQASSQKFRQLMKSMIYIYICVCVCVCVCIYIYFVIYRQTVWLYHNVLFFLCLHVYTLNGYRIAQFIVRALRNASGNRKFLTGLCNPGGAGVEYVYCHSVSFIVVQLISPARHVRCFKLGFASVGYLTIEPSTTLSLRKFIYTVL